MIDVIEAYKIDGGYLLIGDHGYTYSSIFEIVDECLSFMFDYGGCKYIDHSRGEVLDICRNPKLEFRIRRK